MINEFIKQHPNNGKVIVYTEAYLQMRNALRQEIATIEHCIKDTILSNDENIRKSLLPCLKRTLKGLDKRFSRAGGYPSPKYCAQLIADFEREQIADPLQCCRYYDGKAIGEDETALYAEYEKFWTEWRQPQSDRYSYLVDIIAEYLCSGLMWFADNDIAPLSLKALLFNRYCHWNYSGEEGFRHWFYNSYSKGALR